MSQASAAATQPLANGCPPDWASEWGEDRHGVFAGFTLDQVVQRLRWIPAGVFRMGSPEAETEGLAREDREKTWFDAEHPRHLVRIPRGFWLFDTPCTQALWQVVMEKDPSRFTDPARPMERVSWEDVQVFLDRINRRLPGLDLLLPTEAQWEYACRAGTETALFTGDIDIRGLNDAPVLNPIAWYGGNSGVGFELDDGEDSSEWSETQYRNPKSGTHPVGEKAPNPLGLKDMLGNVWEWVEDGWHDSYLEAPDDGSAWQADDGAARVIRGGSWSNDARGCHCASRPGVQPGVRFGYLGFRCARVQA